MLPIISIVCFIVSTFSGLLTILILVMIIYTIIHSLNIDPLDLLLSVISILINTIHTFVWLHWAMKIGGN